MWKSKEALLISSFAILFDSGALCIHVIPGSVLTNEQSRAEVVTGWWLLLELKAKLLLVLVRLALVFQGFTWWPL